MKTAAHLIVFRFKGPFYHDRDSQAETSGLHVVLNGSEPFRAVATLRVQERHVGPAECLQDVHYSKGLRRKQSHTVYGKSNLQITGALDSLACTVK